MPAETSNAIDPLLVIRAQLGDREAVGELLRQLEPLLARYLRSIVGSQETDDLLQDVLLLIYRKIRWLNQPEYVLTWAYRIAGREAFRALRRTRIAPCQLTDAEWQDLQGRHSEARAHRDLLSQEVIYAMAGLPPAARAVLALHYLAEMSIDEAAEHLGIKRGTAKSRLAYGLERLRRRLGLAKPEGAAI